MTSSEYCLPALPLGGSDAMIVRWLKQPGEQVAGGAALLVVLSERAEVALPAGIAGVLTRQMVAEGEKAAVGAPLAEFAPASQEASDLPLDQAEPPMRATPMARRIASEAGIDLGRLAGTGPSGRVVKADVLAALSPVTPHAQAETQATAHLPAYLPARPALEAGPDTYVLTAIDVDAGRIGAVRDRLGSDFARRGLVLTDTLCVLAAAVATLPRHPLLNSAWQEDAIIMRRRLDLALLADGHLTLIPGAQDLNLRGLARALGRQPQAASEASTFAVVEHAGPIWWGQPAILARTTATLGVGAAQARPLVDVVQGTERIVVRRTLLLSLAYDARVLDQCHADAFLRDIKQYLEHLDTFPGV